MTTTTEVTTCPLCDQSVDLSILSNLRLSYEQLRILKYHIKNETLGHMITIADIVLKQMNPEMTSIEYQMNETLSKLRTVLGTINEESHNKIEKLIEKILGTDTNKRTALIENYKKENGETLKGIDKNLKSLQFFWSENQKQDSEVKRMLNEIIQKIGGTGIGSVGEIMVIRDLKQVSPMDSFDETRASRHGSDIVAKVNENGIICGCITVSVKYTQTWSNGFMTQITKDMKVDGSRWGILVTKVFPKEALSDKACVMKTDEGNSVILVKPEYVSLAYFGLRQATLSWFSTKEQMKNRIEENDEMEKTFTALLTWINGEDCQEVLTYIDCAIHEANKTRETMHQVQNYIRIKTEEANKFQCNLIKYLTQTKSLVRKLRELLNGNSSTSDNTSEDI
jgi:hypothetical protein